MLCGVNLAMKSALLWALVVLVLPGALSGRIKRLEERELCTDDVCDDDDACDGTNCNVCSNDTCCDSVRCNSCVNACTSGCRTAACKGGCVQSCAPKPCRSAKCARSKCPSGRRRCDAVRPDNCQTDECQPPNPEKVVVDGHDDALEVPIDNSVNLTTHVIIHNVVNNYNNISSPVHVNATNINNIDIKGAWGGGGNASNTREIERIQIYNETCRPPSPCNDRKQQQPDNCCYVVHPKTCFNETVANSTTRQRCVMKRHWECSDICSSAMVVIEPQPPPPYPPYPYPVPPQKECHFIRQYPYMYCGYYKKRDCGQCNNQCIRGGATYNHRQNCPRSIGCPPACRSNTANCYQTNSGMYCL